ncbi:MAG TPA: menaquinone-dependent protoporphyrinogen IX dehydrogenase [Thiomicrospira sp.]|nr:menaquinone-dependent protoporphyrinogen IX dehydrogenase [Thiomicrospira sp.]
MSKILIVYASIDGQTKKICEYIQNKIAERVTLCAIDEVAELNLDYFDKIVIAASIRYGKFNKKVYRFINKNKSLIESKPNAFITVNVTARKAGKDVPETNSYVQKMIKKSNWQPNNIAIFAGRINYNAYGFFDRNMIKFIMKLTKGPTSADTNIEFTDWDKVDKFCKVIQSTE